MAEFAYTATDKMGKPVHGTVLADNSALAVGKVREMGYTPEKIRSVSAPPRKTSLKRRFAENFIFPVISGVPLKDIALFYRQFATMIDAGISLYHSLVTLENQTRNPKLQEIIRACQKQVEFGGKLSDVFAGYPWVFNDLQIEMIRAAEYGGMLDSMLLRVADYLEQEIKLRQMISRLTLYPKIIVFAAIMILGKGFFVDGMPAFSKVILGAMGKGNYGTIDYLNDTVFFIAIIGLIIFAIVAFCKISLFQSDAAAESYERIKMSIPGLGTVSKKFALAKFGRAFGALYAAGLNLHVAIQVGGNASGSRLIKNATARAIRATERGAVISQAFRETGVFPPMVIDMLHTGEQTGNMDSMMTKAAEYLEGDAETKAHLYSHIFAAAVGLLVAIAVGFAVIRFYGGLGSNVQQYINDGGKE